jgi:hypothetical protein
VALYKSSNGLKDLLLLFVMLVVLAPLSLTRGIQWIGSPAGTARKYGIWLLPHHVWDSLLVLGWMGWFLLACRRMLSSKVAMREGGWSIETWMMRWNELIYLFK